VAISAIISQGLTGLLQTFRDCIRFSSEFAG